MQNLSLKYGFFQNPDDFLQSPAVILRKTGKIRRIDIQNAANLAVFEDGNYYLGVGSAVTGDVAGEFMDIFHQHSALFRRRCAADTLAQWDLDAGRFSLEGA